MAIDHSRSKTKYLSIIVTETCNLGCVYCYEHHKTGKVGNFENIIKFVDSELNKDDGYEKAIIDFFGGEPFLNFELIKSVVEHYKNTKHNKKIHFFATTNGTLIHGHIKKWLIENKAIFTAGLSLDGNKDSQDYNRSNSFDLIDLDFFASNYNNQHIKMTISPYSLNNLASDVIFCHRKGFNVNCNFAYGLDWSLNNYSIILEKQLDLLIDFYMENPSYQPIDMLNGSIKLSKKEDEFTYRWCGVTSDSMKTLGTDGLIYSCQQLLPLTSGKSVSLPIIPSKINKGLLQKECSECGLVDICPSCYSSSFVNYGNPYIKDKGYCLIQKTIIKKRASFLIKRWDSKQLKMTESEEKLLLKQYLEICDYFKEECCGKKETK